MNSIKYALMRRMFFKNIYKNFESADKLTNSELRIINNNLASRHTLPMRLGKKNGKVGFVGNIEITEANAQEFADWAYDASTEVVRMIERRKNI